MDTGIWRNIEDCESWSRSQRRTCRKVQGKLQKLLLVISARKLAVDVLLSGLWRQCSEDQNATTLLHQVLITGQDSFFSQVYGLPTLILFKDGNMMKGSLREGAITKPLLMKYLEKFGAAKEVAKWFYFGLCLCIRQGISTFFWLGAGIWQPIDSVERLWHLS